jgi:hypothetical protein
MLVGCILLQDDQVDKPFHSKLGNKVTGAGQLSMTSQVKLTGCFGVLEYWSKGVLEKIKYRISTLISLIITPSLHHFIASSVNVQ